MNTSGANQVRYMHNTNKLLIVLDINHNTCFVCLIIRRLSDLDVDFVFDQIVPDLNARYHR